MKKIMFVVLTLILAGVAYAGKAPCPTCGGDYPDRLICPKCKITFCFRCGNGPWNNCRCPACGNRGNHLSN